MRSSVKKTPVLTQVFDVLEKGKMCAESLEVKVRYVSVAQTEPCYTNEEQGAPALKTICVKAEAVDLAGAIPFCTYSTSG